MLARLDLDARKVELNARSRFAHWLDSSLQDSGNWDEQLAERDEAHEMRTKRRTNAWFGDPERQ
jgi:hypothetical protein